MIQKQFGPRGRWPRESLRALGTALWGSTTSPTAAGRYATERRLLEAWRTAGLDVPAELSAEHPDQAGPRTLVLEYVEGPTLMERLVEDRFGSRAERDALLERFGTVWRRRHDLALDRDDPSFVHEHASLSHVLLSGERMVSFDLEQAFKPGVPVFSALAREVAGLLRSLQSKVPAEVFVDDVRALVRGYGERERLRRVVDAYWRNPRLGARLMWRLDRWLEWRLSRRSSKYTALAVLERVLEEHGGGG